MKRYALSIACSLVLTAVTVGAQSPPAMHDHQKMEQKPAMDATYVGCLEAGEMAHAFVLTHLMRGDEMKTRAKQNKKTAKAMTGKDAGMMNGKDAGMSMPMLPSTASLKVTPVDVSGLVGQKVSIVGSLADAGMASSQTDSMAHMAVLTVKSVKVLASTCQ